MAKKKPVSTPWSFPEEKLSDQQRAVRDFSQSLEQGQREPAGVVDDLTAAVKGYLNPRSPKPQAAQPKGSGLSSKSAVSNDAILRLTATESPPKTPEQFNSAVSLLTQSDPIRGQMQGINNLESMIAMERGAPLQTDLSPLIGLSDVWTKSKLTGYNRPENGMERYKKSLGYSAKLQDDRNDLAKTILANLGKVNGDKLTGDFTFKQGGDDQITAGDPSGKAGGGGQNKLPQNATQYIKTVRGDPTYKSAIEMLNASKDIISGVGRKDWLTMTGWQTSAVKAARVNPVSNADFDRQARPPGILQKFQALEARLRDNLPLNASDQVLFQDYAQFQLEKSSRVLEEVIEDTASSLGERAMGLDPKLARDLIRPSKGFAKSGLAPKPKSSPGPAGKDIKTMSIEELKRELGE